MSPLFLGPRFRTFPFATMLVFLAACFLGGGASRVDVLSLIYLQPLAVVCLAVFLCTAETTRWSAIRVPLLLLVALAAIMAVQLIPLPPDVWTALPGRATFAQVDVVAGIEHPWRPISLAPDLTLAGLASLSVPFAALVGFASLSVEQTRRLLPYIIAGAALSAFLGVFQLVSGGRSTLYFYEITNLGSAVGVFSNRNHQAVFLAMTWPMLALWAALPAPAGRTATKRWVALAFAVFLLPMIMATGSRGGILLGALGLAVAAMLWRQQTRGERRGRGSSVLALVGVLAAISVIVAAVVFSRDEAVKRLTGMSTDEEVRLSYIPVVLDIVRDFFPVGSGFGSFDSVLRGYEPLELLKPEYFNHAHNDLLEIVMVGGLPAAAVLACFLAWMLRRSLPLLRGTRGRQSLAFAQLGAALLTFLLLSSLVEYPLRTPLMATLACIACGWLSDARKRSDEESRAQPAT